MYRHAVDTETYLSQDQSSRVIHNIVQPPSVAVVEKGGEGWRGVSVGWVGVRWGGVGESPCNKSAEMK